MFLRLIKLLIKQNRSIEDARLNLSSHKTFSLDESFRVFDINGNGKVTEAEIQQIFSDHNIEIPELERLCQILDKDQDGAIDLNEWVAALRPKRASRGTGPANPNMSVELRNLYQRSWLESLADLFGQLNRADSELNSLRRIVASYSSILVALLSMWIFFVTWSNVLSLLPRQSAQRSDIVGTTLHVV